jgi:multidrug efflux pump subunit AcrB/ABC-type multidrug transport system ATPase subunit
MSAGNFIIRRKTLISMLFIGLVMLGVISQRRLPVELIPDIELPYLFVMVRSRPVDPVRVEKDAVIPIEAAAGTLEGIEKIESWVRRGSASITIEYEKGIDVKYAYLKLEEKIAEIRSSIPEEYFIQIFQFDTQSISSELMSLEIRGTGGVERVREVVDREIVQRFESIEGISDVEVTGGREKSVDIVLDDAAIEAYGLTPSRISSLISRNGASNTFVGHAVEKDRKYFVNVVTEYLNISDLERIVVHPVGPVLLGEIAEIYFGAKKQESITRVNGMETVSMNLKKDQMVNMIEVSDRALETVERLNREMSGQEIELVVQYDGAESIRDNINLIVRLAIIGGLLAIVILWFFLRNLRLVFVIALSIPISIYIAMNFFYAAGISINSLTLIGIALAIGMLLDNGVVVLENIYRLVSKGLDADRAVIQGVSEVWRSIVAATATTIIVFLPFVFSSNFIVQSLGKHVGVSIVSTLLVSLVAALLLVPMISHYFLSRGKRHDYSPVQSSGGRMMEIYRVLLKTGMRYPARTTVGAIIIFFFSIILCIGLSIGSSSIEETGSFDIFLVMPRGSTLESTDAAVGDMEERLAGIAETEDLIAQVYEEDARLTIRLKEGYADIDGRNIHAVKNDAKKRLEDFRTGDVSFEEPSNSTRYRGRRGGGMGGAMGGFFGLGGQQKSIVVKGNDFEAMSRFASNLVDYVDNLASTASASFDVTPGSPEIQLMFDMPMLTWHGLTLNSIGTELNSFQPERSSGQVFKDGTDEYEIIIRSEGVEERSTDELREMSLESPSGAVIDLEDISDIVFTTGMTSINRVNQEKQVKISYSFIDEINDSRNLLEAAELEIEELISGLVVPQGMAVEIVEEDTGVDEFKFLILAAFILIYMILASVFESLTTPVVMMFTIPLAAIGSLWLLIFTGTSIIDPYTLTGFLILLGVVVNNGIILIDYSLILRRRGYRITRALITAGDARVRPILITAITTIVAMIPLAMGKEEEVSVIGAPFAITVIGGLTVSTIFTLVFIPVVYSGLESAMSWIRGLALRIKLGQLLAAAAGIWLVQAKIDSLIWRSALFAAVVLAVPAATWFILASLRKASEKVIDQGSAITITVRNLVKIYDQPSKFMREWNKGNRIREKHGNRRTSDAGDLLWQIPFLGFIVYFVYFYLSSFFWAFVLSHAVFFFLVYAWNCWSGRLSRLRIARIISRAFIWLFPLVNLAVFYINWGNLAAVIFIAILWFTAAAISSTARRIRRDKITISRIEGRFAGLRRALYRLVLMIPLIGKRKKPFKALDRVSLEIGSGMFGLLGPNGAGKTTLMRVICGILDQSYGKVYINGIDTAKKREELQGLIGYLPQEFGTYENMTAREFLDYQAILKGLGEEKKRREMVDYVLEAVHIEEHADRKIGAFSGGMKQRVGIAQILLHLPRILVVDEPTAGLDPRERIRFRNLLVELSRERVVIFSTHIIEDIYSSCNRVAVLNRGQLLYLDEPTKMTATATGKVWSFSVVPADFERIRKQHVVVHHMRDGEMIKVRCLADARPVPDAVEARPTLEDAYLWLLRSTGSDILGARTAIEEAAGGEADAQV